MTDPGLWCECRLPLAWQPLDRDTHPLHSLEREALLLLTAINHMEAPHDLEAAGADGRRQERLESKLDLALYLLARALDRALPPPARDVRLTPTEIHWRQSGPAPEPGASLLLELHVSTALPLPLRLPVMTLESSGGWARGSFLELNEALADALHQFLFRRHRQAIRDKRLSSLSPDGPAVSSKPGA